ncbi:Gluconate transport-inducing protein [Boothiomyces sp. JEL0866]|nr:Gluconate transport-inducing protein [Boothiomyces sp. JEL0866]
MFVAEQLVQIFIQHTQIILAVFITGITIGYTFCFFAVKSRRVDVSISSASKSLNIKDYNCKMVLVIRTDLGMGKGKVAAQCSHATLDAYQKAMESEKWREWVDSWEEYGCAKITLKCNDESEMLQLQRDARKKGLVAQSICDAGKTQIAAGSRTVLAIGPGNHD